LTRSPRSSPERPGRRLLPSLLLLACVLLGLPGAAPAGAQGLAGAAEARARAKAALADSRFQRVLPDHAPTQAQEAPRERGASFGGSDGPALLPVLGAGALLAKTIFLVLFLVAVVLIAVWTVQAATRRRGHPGSAAGGSPQAPEVSAAPERELVYDDAARLAAEGRYAEAVHALLIAAIRHFAERSRLAVQPSRTSRELVKLLPLGPDARAAFADLVRTVELSLFGGAPVAAEDYERNLERFRALTRRPA